MDMGSMMGGMMGGGGGGGGGGTILGSIIQFAYGAEQARRAEEEMKKLPEYQRYDTVAEIKDLLDTVNKLSRNPYGAASTSAFRGAVSQAGANAYSRGISQDANLASSILGGVQTSGMQQFGQREMHGDSLKMQYNSMLQSLAGSVQNLQNMNVNEGNQRLLMREQALGQAMAEGKQKMYQGAVSFGDAQENTSKDIVSMMFGMGDQPDKVTNTDLRPERDGGGYGTPEQQMSNKYRYSASGTANDPSTLAQEFQSYYDPYGIDWQNSGPLNTGAPYSGL